MNLATFLILFPLVPAIILLVAKNKFIQGLTTVIGSIVIAVASIGVAVVHMHLQGGGAYSTFVATVPNTLVTIGDIVLALVFLFLCRKLPFKRYWIPLMVVIQYGAVVAYDFMGKMPLTQRGLYVDNLSCVMALVIGIVGTLIAVYTVGYMKHYHHEHPEVKDRRRFFIAAIFLFFFAMFGIVFSNSLPWIYFFWEITTLCSFIMISYSQTDEAITNAFRALWMLLLGGLAFAMALIYLANTAGTVDLQQILTMQKGLVLLPVLLLCFAGMNKAALYPFGNWLLGAMVAPTPSSALLHSSTMVKAGVYLVLRCSPILRNTSAGSMVAIIGGFSFLAGSALALSQTDGKKILAYSTIANLGLIVMCAGIGTPFANWAALLLIIFHAVAKALMFLCVGTVDHQSGSRSVEDMHGLISRMPKVTIVMLIGLAGMFLAPFGMLISKWAVIEALAVKSPIFPPIVIFGGSIMLFFWTKWMGKLIAVMPNKLPNQEKGIGIEWVALWGLAALTIAVAIGYPWISKDWIAPLYGWHSTMGLDVEVTIGIMLALMIVPPLVFLVRWKNLVYVTPYLGGANVVERHQFMGSLGAPRDWEFRNYYMNKFFGEGRLLRAVIIFSTLLWILMFFMEKL